MQIGRWSAIQLGLDLNIFTELSASSTPLTHEELVRKTGAAPVFLQHLLRNMASFGLIKETDKNAFTANRVTATFTDPNVVGMAPFLTDCTIPVILALPGFMKEHKYQEMTDPKNLPFQKAMNTDLLPFEWLKQNGTQMKALGHLMVMDGVQSWADSYPVEAEVGDIVPANDSAMLVDIGGGFGQHAVFFKERYPNLPGAVIVQDLPDTLAHAKSVPGITFQEHDFFQSQPVRGAKFYYLRHVLHDWQDDDCIRILSNIIPSMGPESRILIDEVVLPEKDVPWQVAIMDLCMSASVGSSERTREDWEKLLGKVGLKVASVHQYDPVKYHGIVTAVPV